MNYSQKQSSKQYFADKETETKKELNKNEAVTPSKFTANQNSFSELDSEALNSENQKEELKFFGVSEYYINIPRINFKIWKLFHKKLQSKKFRCPSN